LENSSFKELGIASDNAFLVEGIMNVKNPPEEINERNKHIPCGPKMNYVKDVKGDSEVVHISVILYIPSIGRFFSPNVTAKTPRLDAFALACGDISQTNPNAKVLIPLPSTSLHIEHNTGHPCNGGFFEKFTKVYKIIVSNIAHPLESTILEAHHWPDKDVFITPDVYANYHVGTYPDPRKKYDDAKKIIWLC